MKIKSLILTFTLLVPFAYSQVETLELESVDEMQLLDEFENELFTDDESEKPSQEDVELSEFEEELKEDLDIKKEDPFLQKINQQVKKDTATDDEILDQLEEEFGDGTIEELDFNLDDPELASEFAGTATDEPAEETDELFETLEEKNAKKDLLLEELTQLREKKAADFIKANKEKFTKERKYSTKQMYAYERQLKDIVASPTRYGYVRAGTRLIDLKTEKVVKLPRGITVKAHTQSDAQNFRYIVDKKGDLRYKVYYSKLSHITEVTDLYTKPHYFSRIAKPEKRSAYDGAFAYSVKFNLHGGISLNRYTKDIVEDPDSYAPMLRTELGVLSKLEMPLRIGLSFMYESISGNLQSGGNFSTKILSLGPTIMKENLFENYHLVIQPRISIFADLSEVREEETKVYKLSDTSLMIGLEKLTQFELLGKFVLGANVQRKWLKTKGQRDGFDIGANVSYDDSVALYIGHQSDWLW